MPIQVRWTHTTQTCLRLDFEAAWDWIDYQFAISISAREVKAQDHPVDILVVPTADAHLPPGAFVQFRHSLEHLPSNLGKIWVVAQHDTIFRLVMIAFSKICPDLSQNLILVDSLDEVGIQPGELGQPVPMLTRRPAGVAHPGDPALPGSPIPLELKSRGALQVL